MHETVNHNQLTPVQIDELLESELVGRMATINPDGSPYIVPMHFVHSDGKILMHGPLAGKKIDNIRANPNVCFEVDRMSNLIIPGALPCEVSTAYRSVVIQGMARLVEDEADKRRVFEQFVKKYTPELSVAEMPSEMIAKTSVIEVDIHECTGKIKNYG